MISIQCLPTKQIDRVVIQNNGDKCFVFYFISWIAWIFFVSRKSAAVWGYCKSMQCDVMQHDAKLHYIGLGVRG